MPTVDDARNFLATAFSKAEQLQNLSKLHSYLDGIYRTAFRAYRVERDSLEKYEDTCARFHQETRNEKEAAWYEHESVSARDELYQPGHFLYRMGEDLHRALLTVKQLAGAGYHAAFEVYRENGSNLVLEALLENHADHVEKDLRRVWRSSDAVCDYLCDRLNNEEDDIVSNGANPGCYCLVS